MSKLARAIRALKFDEDDVRAMDEAIRKLDAYIEATRTGFPSPVLLDYTPILSLALLNSLAKMVKQTRWLIVLSCVLGALAIAQVALIVLQVID